MTRLSQPLRGFLTEAVGDLPAGTKVLLVESLVGDECVISVEGQEYNVRKTIVEFDL